MENNAGYVKGQKVISPGGEGHVLEITGKQITVQLEMAKQKLLLKRTWKMTLMQDNYFINI